MPKGQHLRTGYNHHKTNRAYYLTSIWDNPEVKKQVVDLNAKWGIRTLVEVDRNHGGGLVKYTAWEVFSHIAEEKDAEHRAKLFAQPFFPGQTISALMHYTGMSVSPKTGKFKNWSFPIRIDAKKKMRLIGLTRAEKEVEKMKSRRK